MGVGLIRIGFVGLVLTTACGRVGFDSDDEPNPDAGPLPDSGLLPDGAPCEGDAECASDYCNPNGLCATPTCSDDVQNQDETDVDCGGSCDACETPSCTDGELNQDETDVDCGGACDACAEGDSCEAHTDCETDFCNDNVCAAAACGAGSRIFFAELAPYSFDHQCGIANNGTLWCWGNNMFGELGLGPPTGAGNEQGTPVQVGVSTAWRDVAAITEEHTCARQGDSSLWCWGSNAEGQLGSGSFGGQQDVPVQSGVLTGWGSVTTIGTGSTCGIRADESLWCWGDGQDGALASGNTTDQSSPQEVTSPSVQWQYVAGGMGSHACAIDSTESLWCWGLNDYGQVGIGVAGADELEPVAVTGGHTWQKVVAGSRFSCGLHTDETVWCWGRNEEGQLGQGDFGDGTERASPTQVGTAQWLDISSGTDHICAIQLDGTLWCWGDNNEGQMGQGSTSANVPTPVQVGTDTWWESVHLGHNSSCAKRIDGALYCWGDNEFGQLGLGSVGGTVHTPQAVCL